MIKTLKYIYTTFIFDPLAGGNGKIQTAEIAQWVLLVMIISASIKEGKHVDQVYPDTYWFCLFAAVCAIAGLKVAFGKKEDPPSE